MSMDLQTKAMLITLSQYYYNIDESTFKEVLEFIIKYKTLNLPEMFTHAGEDFEHTYYELIHYDTAATDISATYHYVLAVLNK